ncbi:pas pac sensor protein [Leptolyngbya sp. Heron Island J]|uniref:PAS domain S-box protein n=1 Tax=Leptolyngbya sp. Heron Island J TaxID=1385935 RepID=UPI0003B9DF07|nr:PAS domain S-box protein [Leptolyngbya sp. Heron Island J]ESA35885.1 pas pac sensor protein [Leptolyngbya sp. Heron Island J]
MKLPVRLQSPDNLPLRVVLIVLFVGQIVGAVGLVGYLSFRNGQKAVNELAIQLRHEVTARIEQELQSYFETPHEINRLNASAFARGILDVDGAGFGETQLYQQMRIAPTIALAYCGSARNGEFFGVLRSPENGALQLTYSNPSTQNLRRYYSLDVRGERTSFLWQAETPYDSRQRPWYKAAALAERPQWTDIYIAFTTGLPNITASLPVYDRSGKDVLGVCATDVVLPEEFRTFLQSLQIGQTGQAFVIDRQGQLISNSTDEPLMVNDGDTATPLLAINSSDQLVQNTARYLAQRFNGFTNFTEAQQLQLQLNGKRQFLEVLPFQDGFGLDWLIVVVVPEADFMGQINANTRNTILLCGLALLVAIALSVLTARRITRSLLRLSQASDRLAQGHLDPQVKSSFIAEIDTLANSFNKMTRQLKQSFETIRIAEENYRSIFENALEGIFQSSPEGHFINVNPALARLYGYDSPQEMIDSITDIGSQLYVDPARRADFQSKIDQQDSVTGFQYQCYCKDGKIIWTQIHARAVRSSQGQVLYYEGIVQDITERKRREDELKRQLAELKIEIDQQQRQEEVATLTASSYFQEVQQEVAEVDLDEFWS